MSKASIGRRFILGAGVSALLAGVGASRLVQGHEAEGAALDSLTPGKPELAPIAIDLLGPSGTHDALSAHRGAPFLLHLWATWCGPCRLELPELDAFLKAQGENVPVVPVAVASGTPDTVAAFLAKSGLAHIPDWTTSSGDVQAWYKKGGISLPVTFLIDGAGRLRATSDGSLNWADPKAAETIRTIFSKAV